MSKVLLARQVGEKVEYHTCRNERTACRRLGVKIRTLRAAAGKRVNGVPKAINGWYVEIEDNATEN